MKILQTNPNLNIIAMVVVVVVVVTEELFKPVAFLIQSNYDFLPKLGLDTFYGSQLLIAYR